jgi:hypothetical protein
MEGIHFDDQVRNLSERSSRRSALGLLAGALGLVAGGHATSLLARGKQRNGKRKR